ncbi:hypothetical protein TW84_23465 [Vibrio neptunius]|uniref:hypothetical protein n=1 Tax=Vibrio neptunius TaxID=170651 RepID=UPI0005FA0A15|nr:hypothetical protein [Vibrio neptunius]KJY80765.1 hypothetical protein TW84_23465 [Vibrio neptunius]
MTDPTIEQVNQILTQANLAPVKLKDFSIYSVMARILEDNNFSEEANFERVRALLKAGILTELDVLKSFNSRVEDMDLSYEYCPLVKILAPLERDGTLYLSDSERIYQFSWDIYLDYIKSIVFLGGRVDYDGLLYRVFDGRSEFKMFNYLMDTFDVQQETINYVASLLLVKIHRGEVMLKREKKHRTEFEKLVEKDRAAFEKLIEKGIDINLPFSDGDEFNSFLGYVFCYDPTMFEQYLLQKPNQHIIEDLPWEFAIEEDHFHDKQLQLVQKLIELGYQLPLDEIIELLEEQELDDYAKALVL